MSVSVMKHEDVSVMDTHRMSETTVQESKEEGRQEGQGGLHGGAPSTLEPPVLLELLDPVYNKPQSQAGRADGQEFCLFVLVDRDDLCVCALGQHTRPTNTKKERENGRTNRGNVEREQANVLRHRPNVVQPLHDHRVRSQLLQEVVAFPDERRRSRFDGVL